MVKRPTLLDKLPDLISLPLKGLITVTFLVAALAVGIGVGGGFIWLVTTQVWFQWTLAGFGIFIMLCWLGDKWDN